MRTPAFALIPILAFSTPAQQGDRPDDGALVAARQRLAAALRKTAGTTRTAFSMRWGPHQQAGEAGNGGPQAAPEALLQPAGGGSSTGSASGAWFEDLRRVEFGGEQGDEVLLHDTRMIARDGTRPWARRSGRFADGNEIPFVPDPASLLAQLAEWPLAVTRRDAGAIDDRPVEVVSVTLNADQVAELMWSGALPPSIGTPGSLGNRIVVQRLVAARLGGGGGGARPAPVPPDVTIDLAIAIDPGAGLVHEIRVRAWGKPGNQALNVLVQGARVQVGAAAPAQEAEAAPPADGPLEYENGLPKRRGDLVAADLVLRLREHGTAARPALTEEQARLLR